MIIIKTPQPDTEERLVLVPVRRIVPESRDATPADLARAGYVPLAAFVGPLDLLTPPTLAGALQVIESIQNDADAAQERAERAERERDEARRLHSAAEAQVACRSELRTRAYAAERERDTLRAELARLTAPAEGEPTPGQLLDACPPSGGVERLLSCYRLGVAHERARQQPEKDLREVSSELEAMRTTHDERERVYVGAIASDEELVTVYRRAAEPLGDEHGEPLRDLMRRCQARGILAVAARVRGERCLVAQAVAANVDIRVCEDDGGGFMVGVHAPGCDEDLERNVPADATPATLARLLGEVSRG